MANQILARLGVVMTLNAAEWEKEVNQAIAAETRLKKEITKQNKDIEKEILKLTYAVKDYGKELTNLEKVQRELGEGGNFQRATALRKQALIDQATALDNQIAKTKRLQQETVKTAGLTTYQLQALSYQTTDIVTSLAGGQNPMLVLLQQGGQLKDQFGGVTGVFRAFAQVITLTKVVVGGTAAALGTLAYAAYKGNEEFKEFNNAMILSGKIAGITFKEYLKASEELSQANGISLSDSKSIFLQLASSGKFTSEAMKSLATSIALVSRLSGESVDVVGKSLISSFNGTARGVKELDEKYHFLTLEQYKQIEVNEMANQKQKNIIITTNLLNEALKSQVTELGYIPRLVNWISNEWEKLKQIGISDELDKINNEIRIQTENLRTDKNSGISFLINRTQAQLNALNIEKEYLERQKKAREDAAKEALKSQEEKDAYTKTGGLERTIADQFKYQKTLRDIKYQSALITAEGLKRIDLETAQKRQDIIAQYEEKNLKEGNARFADNEKIKNAELSKITQEGEQKKTQLQREAIKSVKEKISETWNEVDANRELIELFNTQKVITEDDLERIKVRAKAQEELNKIIADPRISQAEKDRLQLLMMQAYTQKEFTEGRKKLLEKALETEKAVRDAQKTESDSVALEKRKLEIYSENLLMTEAERDIALSRLETEQKIAAIRQKILDNPEFGQRGNDLIANQQLIQQRREEVIGLTERLKVLRDVNQAVFSSMENAIVNFVNTGKLSFKDLARTIIQSIFAIYMKAQMLQMFKGFGGLFSASSGAATTAGGTPMIGDFGFSTGGVMTAADGGYISGPTLVGENGPELFIPRTAGTIVPNQQMAGMTGTPQVVYNGPYIANMQAIDTQSAAQFLARNKESVWAANQSASRSVPQSR